VVKVLCYKLEGRWFDPSVYNEQASRSVVVAFFSVYVAECSESSSCVRGVFTSVV